MFKKIIALVIVLSVITVFCVPAFADTAQYFDADALKSFLIAESVSEKIIASKAADEKTEVAGLVKTAPLLLVCEAFDKKLLEKESEITVSREAASLGGVSAFLESGEKIKAELLLKSAVMIGASDAVYALCESLYQSEAAFVEKLNVRLNEIGVDGQYQDIMGKGVKLSATELMLIGKELCKSETFKCYSSIFYDSITHEDGRITELANPNKLVRNLPGCMGVSTGSSNEAGYCGVFSVTRNDTTYIAVTIGCKNSSERFKLAEEMTEYAFATYKTLKVATKGDIMEENVPINGGVNSSVSLAAKDDCMLIFENGSSYEAFPVVPDVIEAPVLSTDVVGKIEYKNSAGDVVGMLELCPVYSVEKASFWDNVCNILRNFLHA